MPTATTTQTDFKATLAEHGLQLQRSKPQILQLNTGRLCNLTCVHCHVNAGPGRKEIITRETVDRVLDWLRPTDIDCIDLTGGTPEMVPDFPHLVETVRAMGKRVMVEPINQWWRENGYNLIATENAGQLVAIATRASPETIQYLL